MRIDYFFNGRAISRKAFIDEVLLKSDAAEDDYSEWLEGRAGENFSWGYYLAKKIEDPEDAYRC